MGEDDDLDDVGDEEDCRILPPLPDDVEDNDESLPSPARLLPFAGSYPYGMISPSAGCADGLRPGR